MTIRVTPGPKLLLLTRRQCCLCQDIKSVIEQVRLELDFELEEIDIDHDPRLKQRYSDQIPVIFIDGRKAFKYRVSIHELRRRLRRSYKSQGSGHGQG